MTCNNQGIAHAAYRDGGFPLPLCRARRAHISCEIAGFRAYPKQCKRCAAKLAKMDAASARRRQREADRIDGYDRDDLGCSPDYPPSGSAFGRSLAVHFAPNGETQMTAKIYAFPTQPRAVARLGWKERLRSIAKTPKDPSKKLCRPVTTGTYYRVGPAISDARGRRVTFCYYAKRNDGGYFLGFKRTALKNGKIVRSDLIAMRGKKALIRRMTRRAEAFSKRLTKSAA
jgi:hypothetical protein